MDDRKFREIMEDYARSTAKGKETDFAKANAATQAPRKKINLRWVTAVCSVVIIVAVSLAVALPLILGGDSPSSGGNDGQGGGNDTQYYCKEENTIDINVSSYENLRKDYGVGGLIPSLDSVVCTLSVIYSEEYDVAIGSSTELVVYNEYFNIVRIKAIKCQYILESVIQFDELSGKAVWAKYNVLYSLGDSNGDGVYNCLVTFGDGEYNYFIELDCYGELDVATVLDMIYG